MSSEAQTPRFDVDILGKVHGTFVYIFANRGEYRSADRQLIADGWIEWRDGHGYLVFGHRDCDGVFEHDTIDLDAMEGSREADAQTLAMRVTEFIRDHRKLVCDTLRPWVPDIDAMEVR